MGYLLTKDHMNLILHELAQNYEIYAPKVFAGEGCFSDTDSIRYGQIGTIDEIVFDKKSDYSFKEVLFPVSETLFYFTEDQVKVPDQKEKGRVIFLRSCDLHAVKRFDEIYLQNGFDDFYYKRLREQTTFILMGCEESFDNCFCVSMGTNQCKNYDAYIHVSEGGIYLESSWGILSDLLKESKEAGTKEKQRYVQTNPVVVSVPERLDQKVIQSSVWEEYSQRCIACGRCNFACPTCTCFTMQDIYYKENEKAGERKRVWASCHVDGFTDMAGGHSFRQEKGQRMRFKVMHKIYDYKKRFGYHMCVGCGRCDDICPEYISFSNCVNRLHHAVKEVESL